MKNQVANIGIENLESISHNQTNVLTTELLADLYGTDSVRIRQNFNRNKIHFVEGKHFFELEGTELKEFKNRASKSYSVEIVGKNTKKLTLWTERGAGRHAKMLETEEAWNVFEKLEDNYFNKRQNVQEINMTLIDKLMEQAASNAALQERNKMLSMFQPQGKPGEVSKTTGEEKWNFRRGYYTSGRGRSVNIFLLQNQPDLPGLLEQFDI